MTTSSASTDTSTSTSTTTVYSTTTLKPIFFTTTQTVFITPTPKPTSSSVSDPQRTTTSPTHDQKATWQTPEHYSDLSSFGITKFATGKNNLQIVSTIPDLAQHRQNPNGGRSMLQLFYPEHSVNPSARPVGGADFYANPFKRGVIEGANTVSLSYAIFFPEDFDFVKGGKLPGLYGGRTTCSGGADASDCFSTRLMWRSGGAGELYLYAPKDKQTKHLCSTVPRSYCGDQTYGLSIGRGSFTFKRGGWTRVTQSVRLNTPGKNDGGFSLVVDGKEVIRAEDIYYRDAPKEAGQEPSSTTTTPDAQPTQRPSGNDGGLLGGLLSGLLGRDEPTPGSILFTPEGEVLLKDGKHDEARPASQELQKSTPSAAKPVGFAGLFFSTFFGGHGSEWESPKDQYVWFGEWSMSVLN